MYWRSDARTHSVREQAAAFAQFIRMFVITLIIQTLHMVEHVAQVVQKFVLDFPYAHGLIGSFDVEQVHFTFNLLYLGTLFYITLGWLNFGSQMCRNYKMLGAILVTSALMQSYHMVEHSAKLIQFFGSGLQGTPGILGAHFDGVIFHAVMNTGVYLPVVVVFFCSGMQRYLFTRRYGIR